MTYRSLKQYFDHRIITDLLASNTEDCVIIEGSEKDIVRIPVVAWVLVEFYVEDKNKNGTIITAAFIDPYPVTDENGDTVTLTTLTTLDMFLRHHPDKTFLRFERPSAPILYDSSKFSFSGEEGVDFESRLPVYCEDATISAEGNVSFIKPLSVEPWGSSAGDGSGNANDDTE